LPLEVSEIVIVMLELKPGITIFTCLFKFYNQLLISRFIIKPNPIQNM